ncbi:MAG: hypothetical protein J0M12_13335 [Deltaproteobacteria bacterium]|nr:hypothetical protein [Deltaproteobacteria bacterium]
MPRIIAHRGARSEAPENTLSAFRRARELPVHMVEGDVAVTKDGVAVFIHQETLEPAAGSRQLRLAARNEARAWISASSWNQIKDLDAGSWFGPTFSSERIPTLEEVLSLGWSKQSLLLDLIDPRYWVAPDDESVVRQFQECVIPTLRAATAQGASLAVLAFNPCMLELFQRELPLVPRTYALWTNSRGMESYVQEQANKLKISTLTIADFMLRDEPQWLALARDAGYELGVFELTPDSHEQFRSWTPQLRQPMWDLVIEKHVDWFTTDFPAEFVAYQNSIAIQKR